MKIKRIILMVALIISVASAQAQKSQVIAHRGYWKTAGSAQNSITALQKADSIHCYGSEFDVWLTKDNKLVINHYQFSIYQSGYFYRGACHAFPT